jgi:hypothetical protein
MVKVAVVIALGVGTMVAWKRIVTTVGERIGKAHLTSAQGASAESVAHDRCGRCFRVTDQYDACAVVRRSRDDGGKQLRIAAAHPSPIRSAFAGK